MVNGVVVFDIVGAFAFLLAFIHSVRNYLTTKYMSSYWLVFSIAAFLGFLWAGSVSLEWMGFYPVLIDEIQQSIVAAAATAFAIAAVLTSESLIQPTE